MVTWFVSHLIQLITPAYLCPGISGGNIFASMAQSIENSCALVCFMTDGYEKSSNGEKELTYADNTGVRVIPCLLQESVGGGEQYRPTGMNIKHNIMNKIMQCQLCVIPSHNCDHLDFESIPKRLSKVDLFWK